MANINSFNSNARHLSTDTSFHALSTTDLTVDYAITDKNLLQKIITVNNTGKPQQEWVSLKVTGLESLIYAGKTTPAFNDWQFWDNSANLLPHYVQYYTYVNLTAIIFIKVTVPAGATINISWEYGNPSLKNRSNPANTFNSVFDSNKMTAWAMANQVDPDTYFTSELTGSTRYIHNWAKVINPFDTEGGDAIPLSFNPSGLSTTYFNLVDVPSLLTFRAKTFLPAIKAGQTYCVFLVEQRPTTADAFVIENDGVGSTNNKFHLAYRSTGVFSFAQWGNDLNYTVGNTTGQTRIWCCRATSTGKSIRLNGVTVANNANTTLLGTDGRLILGGGDTRIFEVISFSDKELTTTEIEAIESYLNHKYRVFNTSNFPTVTVGTEATFSSSVYQNRFAYTNYKPLSSFNIKHVSDNEITGAVRQEGSVKVNSRFNRCILTGNSVETWTGSTTIQESNTSTFEAQRVNVTSTPVLVSAPVKEQFLYDTTFAIEAGDYLMFELYSEDANLSFLDLPNTTIGLTDTVKGFSYVTTINNNDNGVLQPQKLNYVKIPLDPLLWSVGGAGFTNFINDLQTIDKFDLQISALFLSTTIQISNIQVIKNLELAKELQEGSLVKLGSTIYDVASPPAFSLTALEGKNVSRLIGSQITEIGVQSLLTEIGDREFGELEGFPVGQSVILQTDNADPVRVYRNAVNLILGLFLPSYKFDTTNLSLQTGTDTTALFASSTLEPENLRYYVLRSTDKVRDILNKFLEACFGYIYFSPASGRYIATNAYKTFADVNSSLPTPVRLDSIISYKSNTQGRDGLYNRLSFLGLRQELLAGISAVNVPLEGINASLPANSVTTVIFNKEQILEQAKSNGTWQYQTILGGLALAGWNTQEGNTNLILQYVIATDEESIIFVVQNNGSVEKTLTSLSFWINILGYRKNDFVVGFDSDTSRTVITRGNFYDYLIEDTNSIDLYGRKSYPIDERYTYAGVNTSTLDRVYTPIYDEFITSFSSHSEYIEVDIPYNPNIFVGCLVQLLNENQTLIQGLVVEMITIHDTADFVSTIKVRRII